MDLSAHGMTQDEIDAYQERYGKGPHFAADLVVVSIPWQDPAPAVRVLLIRRAHPPFQGRFALPGGFVEIGEDLEDAARRELGEETGLSDLGTTWVEQLQTYGMPTRDPRARVISVVYLALVGAHELKRVQAGDDAADARFFVLRGDQAINEDGAPLKMAFDHEWALRDLRARLRQLAQGSSAPLLLLPEEFTIEQARIAYELLVDRRLDAQRFEEWIQAEPWLASSQGARFRLVDRRPTWAQSQPCAMG